MSFLSFYAPLHMLDFLFISRINRAGLYKGLSDSQRQPNSDLAQWQSMRLMIWRLWVQTPLEAIFDEIYFVLCNFRSVRLSDRSAYHEKLLLNLKFNHVQLNAC